MKILETEKIILYNSKMSHVTFVCAALGCRPCCFWFNSTGAEAGKLTLSDSAAVANT